MDRFVYRDKNKRIRDNNSEKIFSVFNTPLAKVSLLVVSAILFYNIANSINITIQKLDILKRAHVEVDDLRLENLELALLLNSMQSKEYLEVQARDRLSFTGESETVFIISESVLDKSKANLEKILYGNMEVEKKETYQVWKDFVLNSI